jgi:tetratricopeptide (TPR) repeat protein
MRRYLLIVLSIAGTVIARDSPPSASWYDLIARGQAFVDLGYYVPAETAYRKALAATETFSSPDKRLLLSLDLLASVESELGNASEAERLYCRALLIAEQINGRDSLDYSIVLGSLASLRWKLREDPDAIGMLKEAIRLDQRAASPRHLAIARNCLAEILIAQKRYAEAEELLLQARGAFAREKDLDSLRIILNNLGILRYLQRRYPEAIDLFEESLKTSQSHAGDAHLLHLRVWNNLAASYEQTGRYQDAGAILAQAKTLCEQSLGAQNPTYAEIIGNYSVVLKKLGRKREARRWRSVCLKIRESSQRARGDGLSVSLTALRSGH